MEIATLSTAEYGMAGHVWKFAHMQDIMMMVIIQIAGLPTDIRKGEKNRMKSKPSVEEK